MAHIRKARPMNTKSIGQEALAVHQEDLLFGIALLTDCSHKSVFSKEQSPERSQLTKPCQKYWRADQLLTQPTLLQGQDCKNYFIC